MIPMASMRRRQPLVTKSPCERGKNEPRGHVMSIGICRGAACRARLGLPNVRPGSCADRSGRTRHREVSDARLTTRRGGAGRAWKVVRRRTRRAEALQRAPASASARRPAPADPSRCSRRPCSTAARRAAGRVPVRFRAGASPEVWGPRGGARGSRSTRRWAPRWRGRPARPPARARSRRDRASPRPEPATTLLGERACRQT
jgi:hypothetical protein